MTPSYFVPPFEPYDPHDKAGFSYETVVKRWPIIITGVIDQLHNACHDLSMRSQDVDSTEKRGIDIKIKEGQEIIEKISRLKYQMGRDHAMEPIPEDGEPLVAVYNDEMSRLSERGKNTWFTAPWLFAECYLYRLLRAFFAQTGLWNNYDPFLAQKVNTFQQSGTSIFKIATTMHELEDQRASLESNPENLAVVFKEMIQMCLWGNATDLSLLTHLSPSDIEHLQSVGKEAQAARQEFILKDDQDAVWKHVQSLKDGRLDFVLDNAGFELFTDLVFADFMVTYTPYISRVVFHPKLIPWFVSDVTPADFGQTINQLLDISFFPAGHGADVHHLKHMVTRWSRYLEQGIFACSVPVSTRLGGNGGRSESELVEFWTSPWPYWDMKLRSGKLYETLQRSDLVIFKGDLNYRKLTGDVAWPAWTPFLEALGPLAGSFPLLSLRTNKADVVVGVDREVANKLDDSGEKWRVDGRYALISFLEANGKPGSQAQ